METVKLALKNWDTPHEYWVMYIYKCALLKKKMDETYRAELVNMLCKKFFGKNSEFEVDYEKSQGTNKWFGKVVRKLKNETIDLTGLLEFAISDCTINE
jgi:hypothetical protein